MKFHFYSTVCKAGLLNLDKKIPLLAKTYPQAKIEKSVEFNYPCIKGAGIAKNTYLVEILGQKIKSEINIDFYGYSPMWSTFFDISFDIDESMAKELILLEQKDFYNSIFLRGSNNVKVNDKAISFESLIVEYVLPYFDVDNTLALEESFVEDMTLNERIAKVEDKIASRPYCTTGILGGLSVGTGNNIIIEDNEDQLELDNQNWENITVDDNSLFMNKKFGLLVCKDKKFYADCQIYNFHTGIALSLTKYSHSIAKRYFDAVTKQGMDIKKNIIDKNRNPYYWKELKQTIEVLDLNFLEFYSDTYKIIDTDYDTLFSNWPGTKISEKFRVKFEDKNNKAINDLQNTLNEVKYAISNISSPIHAQDEANLQRETEKVNDRILMLSFIAMAVSAIGMVQSDEINTMLKLISGISIFSLPIIYYFARNIMNKISIRKNEKNELHRKLEDSLKGLERTKLELKHIMDDEELNDDFKESAGNFMKKFIVAEQDKVDRLKKKIK